MPRRLKDTVFQRAVKYINADTVDFGARPPRAAVSHTYTRGFVKKNVQTVASCRVAVAVCVSRTVVTRAT